MSARQTAIDIFNKLENSVIHNPRIAVFLFPDGMVKSIKTSTDLYRQMCQRKPERLVGVYDLMGSPEKIQEDLEAMGL